LGEALVTYGALVRLFPRVDAHMPPQVVLGKKALAALAARERLSSAVNEHVGGQVKLSREPLMALAALKRSVWLIPLFLRSI